MTESTNDIERDRQRLAELQREIDEVRARLRDMTGEDEMDDPRFIQHGSMSKDVDNTIPPG